MSEQPPAPPQLAPTDAAVRAMVERQLAKLEALSDLGMRIAASLTRQTEAAEVQASEAEDQAEIKPAAPSPSHDVGLAFGRVSRAVRLTIALQLKLSGELNDWEAEQAGHRRLAALEDEASRRDAAEARKARIERLVERIAQTQHEEATEQADAEAVERLVETARERLEDEDVFGDLLDRPVSETIGLICRDLGLSPDWPALAEEAWAQNEIDSGDVGPPLAALAARPAFLGSPRRWLAPTRPRPAAGPAPAAPKRAKPGRESPERAAPDSKAPLAPPDIRVVFVDADSAGPSSVRWVSPGSDPGARPPSGAAPS